MPEGVSWRTMVVLSMMVGCIHRAGRRNVKLAMLQGLRDML
jgi:hypothetical protein